MGLPALRALAACKEYRVQADHRAQMVLKARREPREPKERGGFKVLKVLQELRDL